MPELDTEWLEALEIEPTGNDDKGDDDSQAADEPTEEAINPPTDDQADEAEEAESEKDKGVEESNDDTSGSHDNQGDPDKADKARDNSQDENENEDIVSTKDSIKEALREIETERIGRTEVLDGYKQEVTEALYPEGIDRTLRDSGGDPINGIDDLTKLINPKTDDYFTEEEAGAWLLAAKQQLNEDVEKVERFIEQVAEVNLALKEGAERVAVKYNDILSQDTELKDRLLAAYNKTLTKDPKTGITIRFSMDVEEFFDTVLEPMIKSNEAVLATKAKQEQDAKDKKAKNGRTDRSDLKQKGSGEDAIDSEDKEWLDAIKKYEEN